MNDGPLTIHLTPADYAVAQRHIAESLQRQAGWYWPLRAVGVAIGLLSVLGFIGLFTYEPSNTNSSVRSSALMLIGAAALLWLAAVLYKRSAARVLFAAGSQLLQPCRLSLSEAGVSLESPSGSANLPWSAIAKAELKGDHLFVFTRPDYAAVVPLHAFSSRTELEAFAARVLALKAKHGA